MTEATKTQRRTLSPGEELANTISHGAALALAIAALPILIVSAVRDGGAGRIVGATIFGTTMVLLYLTSTLYHALPPSRAKRVFRMLDHGAIYLLIAGTYTPFTLGALSGAWGWVLFGIVWGLALTGIVAKAIGGPRHLTLSTILYIGMGWLVLIAIRPLLLNVPTSGVIWLLAGGLAYTAGVAFYRARHMRYSHFVWHLFVIAGTACHFAAVRWYSA